MRIIGVEAPGAAAVFSCDLLHGAELHRLIWEHGFELTRMLSALGTYPDLSLTVQVRRHGRPVVPLEPPAIRMVEPDVIRELDTEPVLKQRIAAYSIALSERGILATQFSAQTAVPGLWGLPGGGINIDESPSQAATREVMEETGQSLQIAQLLDLQTDHWIGHSPTGVVEDFHAVRIIYLGRVEAPTDPVVNDIGGTTSTSVWVPLTAWKTTPWAQGARTLLERHLPALTHNSD